MACLEKRAAPPLMGESDRNKVTLARFVKGFTNERLTLMSMIFYLCRSIYDRCLQGGPCKQQISRNIKLKSDLVCSLLSALCNSARLSTPSKAYSFQSRSANQPIPSRRRCCHCRDNISRSYIMGSRAAIFIRVLMLEKPSQRLRR